MTSLAVPLQDYCIGEPLDPAYKNNVLLGNCATGAVVLKYHRYPDDPWRRRLLQQLQTIHSLNHPNLLTPVELMESQLAIIEVTPYLAPPWKDVYFAPKLAFPDACVVMQQLLRGLMCLHEHGLVHNDVKGRNVMVHAPTLETKVLDFDCVTPVACTSHSACIPTSAQGACMRGDVYGAGEIFRSLTHNYHSLLWRGPGYVPRDDVPPEAVAVITKAMADRDDCYATCREFLEALELLVLSNHL